MRQKEILHYFSIIDYGIKVFNADKGFKVDSTQYNDWLVFDQRTIRWTKNDIDYLLQIFPNFDDREEIVSWTLYGAVSYDTETDRYLIACHPAPNVTLKEIAVNATKLFNAAYDCICSYKKDEIPHAVEFTKY
ncbi:MAG TPA: hypothetical protein VGI43_03535 [Mucilaginibacter sp.]